MRPTEIAADAVELLCPRPNARPRGPCRQYGTTMVTADPTLLFQLLQNLLENALPTAAATSS